ncbi:MAG: hypothetical protein Q7T01_02965 [bacterium]|nr:hypothetical protein [bacterium]
MALTRQLQRKKEKKGVPDAQRADHWARKRDARQQARRHRDLASRQRDMMMSEQDIADERLQAARK